MEACTLQDMAELPPIDQHLEKEHQEKTKVKNIQCVEMGKYEVSTVLLTPPLIVPQYGTPHCCTAVLTAGPFATHHALPNLS